MGKFIVTILLAMVVFAGCDDDYGYSDEYDLVCTDENTNKISRHALDFFFFKTGSWWVYEEEKTGKLDSVWVFRHTGTKENEVSSKQYCGCGYGKCSEMLEMYFENKEHYWTFKDEYYYMYRLRAGIADASVGISMPTGGVSYNANGRLEEINIQHGMVETLENLKVKDSVFKDIVYIYHTNPDYDYKGFLKAWYARNVHLVKYEKQDSTVWNLVQYHVVQ